MVISSESLIFIIVTLAAAAVGLCYLPVVRDVSAFIIKQRQKTHPTKQLEQKLLKCHQGILNQIEAQARTGLEATLAKIEVAFAKQLTTLEKGLQNESTANRQELKTAMNKYLQETQIALHGLVEKAAVQIDDELAKELQTTRAEVETHKQAQMQKIDNEIATIVEKTIYKTLGKGLSLEDHLDLIYEALAEAKEEGFFKR